MEPTGPADTGDSATQSSSTGTIGNFAREGRANRPRIPYIPFVIADLLLLGTAVVIVMMADRPMNAWEISAVVVCVAAAASFMVYPFRKLIDFELRQAGSEKLHDAVQRIRTVESLAARIESVTSHWMEIEKKAEHSLDKSEDISREMIEEADSFREFIKNAQSEETQHLRLMVEKLRKAEKDWVHIIMAMMDHSIALRWAAEKSGNANLAAQIGNFHAQLIEITRQIGLLPFEPQPGDSFDSEIHQLMDSESNASEGTSIKSVRSAGYRFRGVVLRRALVIMGDTSKPENTGGSSSSKAPAQPASPAPKPPRKPVRKSPADSGSSTDEDARGTQTEDSAVSGQQTFL